MRDTTQTISANLGGATSITGPTFVTLSFALSRGLTFEEIEEATGLPRAQLLVPSGRQPEDVAPRLWRLIAQKSPPTDVPSLAMARSAPFTILGGLIEAAHFAQTGEEALRFLVKNGPFVSERLEVAMHNSARGELAMSVMHPLDEIDGGRLSELGTALMVRVLSMLLDQRVSVRRVEYAHTPCGPEEIYRSYFRAPVYFNMPRTQLIFDENILYKKVKHANFELFRHVQQHFDLQRQMVKASNPAAPLRSLDEAVEANARDGDYRASSAAARAGLSVRSAQRLASTQGQTLTDMVNRVRRRDAENYLADPMLPLEAVALMLGYSDDRAFRRAFKAWTGKTPSEYRRNVLRG